MFRVPDAVLWPPAPLEPVFEVVEDDDAVAHVLDILRWALPNDESPIALLEFVNASAGDIGLKGGYLGVTPTRFFLAARGALAKDGNLAAHFADWAASGDPGEQLRRVADVLMAAANLPAEEMRSDPLLEVATALPS